MALGISDSPERLGPALFQVKRQAGAGSASIPGIPAFCMEIVSED